MLNRDFYTTVFRELSVPGTIKIYFFPALFCSAYQICSSLKMTHCYHPPMRVGNVFSHVCLCVCVSVCLSVCLSVCPSVCPSVQTIPFELLDIESSFLVCRYIITISRSTLSINITGSRSRSYEKKMIILLISTCESSVYGYRSLMRSRSHIKVKVTSRSK